jgi:alpha-glucosidase (family GH31 glycosyl hydrolase)/CubicO group peptidase (beta-lactamase class C family)
MQKTNKKGKVMNSQFNARLTILLVAMLIVISTLESCSTAKQTVDVPTAPSPTEEILEIRVKFQSGEQYLIVEFLDDDLVHFELSGIGTSSDTSNPIYTSPMIVKKDYAGPTSLERLGAGTFETPNLRIEVDEVSLCVTATDIAREPDLVLSQFCPWHLEEEFKGMTFTPENFTNAYGLGQKFLTPGSPDGDWVGQARYPGEFGNVMEDFNNGKAGNTQFPILYFAGDSTDSYALFVDNHYMQFWSLLRDPWKVVMYGEKIRFYIMTGPDLQDLRSDYMELVGHPLVPPKKMFGMWVSEYGFDNWGELEDKLRTLRANRFPIDGFVLDLQWFGGITEGSDDTQEGSLTWDEVNFPDPEAKIAALRDEEGIGLMVIEQSYVGRNLSEHSELEEMGYLVRACETCEATYLEENPWWGKGGMIDWTNEEASTYWHDWKREPLIEDGIIGHWTDLGEPELYDPDAWYAGIPDSGTELHDHTAVHNLYNYLWSKSIYDGYLRNEHTQRPFILSRSGAPGIQRFGTAIWSGDISGFLTSLAAHFNAQMHMSMSGLDYYSADIGGFWRQEVNTTEMYTQWFAYGMLFDIPGRPHTFNVGNWTETAPDRIGDLESNLQNVRLRYSLSPYVYSLAHRAFLYAEPVFPPLVYYFQTDPEVREMGGEKLIGRDLLVGVVANSGELEREVYLPEGVWIDFHTGEWIESSGEWFGPFMEYPVGYFTPLMFARAGGIIPLMYVDEQTMNIMGKRLDGSTRDELIVRVYADSTPSSFTLYEDDGVSTAYQRGEVRTTEIRQQQQGNEVSVTIAGAQGTYAGASERRDNVIQLHANIKGVPTAVVLNGSNLTPYEMVGDLEAAERGFAVSENGVVIVKSGEMDISDEKVFAVIFSEEVAEQEISQPLPITWPTEGWRNISPEQVGLDSELLVEALDYIQRKNIHLHNIFMARNGYLVMDTPIYRVTRGRSSDQLSATRSVIATLVGIAINQGYLEGVDQSILDFFTDREFDNLDADKEAITIKDLLTMRSGLTCSEPETSTQMKESADWVQFMLDLPMRNAPGEEFVECNGVSHLLSAILQEATGKTAFAYAQETLFEPMGITEINWASDPNGVSLGWQGLQMSPRDTAKIGVLYLNGGNWDGVQLVPSDWVESSITEHVPTEDGGFGYQWWVDPAGTYVSREEQGQWMVLIPDLDLIVVYTSGQRQREPLILQVLLRSFIVEAASPLTLPENPDGVAKLQEQISAIGETPEAQVVPPLPETALRISGKTYIMDEGNSLGWEEFRVTFPGGSEAKFSLLAGDVSVELPIGLDGIYRLPAEESGYPDEALVATRGWWETEQVFLFEYDYVLIAEHNILRFIFEDDRLEVTIIIPQGEITLATGQMKQ